MSREVLQQALAVLKGCLEHPDAQDSIIAIEHELAQPEQEPVAWMDEDGDVLSASIVDGKGLRNIPLYTSPPQRQPLTTEQYTALAHRIASKYSHRSDLTFTAYTFLPHTLEQFVRAIEAAHGIGDKT